MKNYYLPLLFFLLTSLVAYAQPPQMYSQNFNGNQFFVSPTTANLNAGNTFTYEAWVFITEASPYGVVAGKVFAPRADDPFINYTLGFGDTGLRPEFVQTTGLSGSYKAAASTTNIQLNTWTHLAATSDNGSMKLYINGILAATNASTGMPNPSPDVPFAIGSGATPSLQPTCCGIKGNIMQVRIWNTARSVTELTANMNSQLSGNETNLVAYYPMNENAGQILQDKTSNALHLQRGTATGTDPADPIATPNATNGQYFIYSNITVPSLASANEDLYIIDFDNDAKLDFLVSGLQWPPTMPATTVPIQAFKNNGLMSFSSNSAFIGNNEAVHPRSYVVADYNGDGKSDLFIADHGTDVSPFPGQANKLFLQNTTGKLVDSPANIPSQPDFSHYTTAADIDADGDIDIYVSNIWGQALVGPYFLINNGNGNFTKMTSNFPAAIQNLNQVYMSSIFADIDNDNDQDLILGAVDNSNLVSDLILLNNGTGTFTPGSALPPRYGNASWGTVGITKGDFNNDGFVDLVMSTLVGYQTCMVQLLLNNGNGTFSDHTSNIPQNWPTSNTWIKWIEAGDINNDGHLDLVFATHFAATPKLYYNNGNGFFTDASSTLNPSGMNGIRSTRVRDFDGDGQMDIAFLGETKVVIAKAVQNFVLSAVEIMPVSKKLIIFPNPTTGSFSVKLPDNEIFVKLEVFDLNGRAVFSSDKYRDSYNLENFSAGIYIVKISTKLGNYSAKLIKR